jgi:hypothetical protein
MKGVYIMAIAKDKILAETKKVVGKENNPTTILKAVHNNY